MTQKCFPGLKPQPPTIRTERVARAIATRIVEAVNLDDYYWEASEVPERIEDVAREIMRVGYPASVFDRLCKQQPFIYGWDDLDDHCSEIGDEIAIEELAKAMAEYMRDYEP